MRFLSFPLFCLPPSGGAAGARWGRFWMRGAASIAPIRRVRQKFLKIYFFTAKANYLDGLSTNSVDKSVYAALVNAVCDCRERDSLDWRHN